MLGNLVAIPGVTFIIMPLGIVSLLLGSFFNFPIDILDFCLEKMAFILGKISEIPGANLVIKSPELPYLYAIVLGGIILCLLKSKAKFWGFLPIFAGGLG